VSAIGGNYRLYREGNGLIQHSILETGAINPEIDTRSYEGTNDQVIHITPWFNPSSESDATALRVLLDCRTMTSTETVKVEYALNYSGTYESASTSDGKSTFTVSSDGVSTAVFPKVGTTATPPIANTTPQTGTDFQAIRFKLTLNRGSTATLSPNVKSLTLEWRRKIAVKWGFTVDIDHRSRIEGRSPETQLDDLRTAIESGTLVELSYRDRDDNAENYYVDIIDAQIIEETGNQFEGVTRLSCTEV
jgi:hypothetical protein